KKPNIVIVGGGFGGLKTALDLAKDKDIQVTLISDKDHFLYYPALYATATGQSHLQSVVELETILAFQPRIKLIVDEMTGLDTRRKHVVCKSGTHVDYDQLVLALGVVTSYFGIKGLDKYSYGIKSKAEIDKFKDHLHDMLSEDHHLDKHYVVVGAGPTGVELAAALATYLKRIAKNHKVSRTNVRLSLVEASPRVLPRMSDRASRLVHKRLEELGVKIQLNAKVEGEDDDEVIVNGKPLLSQTVIWTSGVSNHPFFAEHKDIFQLDKRGRVVVDGQMLAAKDIYVIGDNASTPYSGLAQTALHDAIFVARNLKRRRRKLPTKAYRSKSPPVVVPVGRNWAIFEWGPLRLRGRPAAWVRRAADAIGYHDILPIGQALSAWRAETVVEEDCPVCLDAIQS
ncbi:MAG TPA: FAD-dependent oxidoreductase, partial [Candidatus Saccharimonadales bacterium]|nr:FAD-dependent oxidoreductase [Candidatus Saccharimonadales bacterium]